MQNPKESFLYFLFILVITLSCGQKNDQEENPLFVPDELDVTLWASSPQFFNPTNMDVDVRGRVWVTEAVNYRDFRNSKGHMVREAGDRVVILEDTNGDGQADSTKVFVQDKDLRAPLGIAVLGNQVIVSCSPSVIIYTDEDGDDVPDRKQVFLTGFGGRDHDHGLHAGVMGPDGKWYFITGNAGPHQVKGKDGWTLRSGSVYNEYTPYSTENIPAQVSDDGEIYTGGLVIRVNPDGTGMEVMSHNFRNAFEVSVDSFGNMWQSDNDDQTASCRTSWLMEGSNAGFFSDKGERTWQADRRPGQTIAEAHWHQHDPGVQPAGDIYGAGSPTGIVRIEGDELGEQYRGLLLSADAGRNIIFGYQPQIQGSGYALRDRQHFISSVDVDNENYIWHEVEEDNSKWFRPSDVAVGTDGSLFVADWYDPIVGGHQMRDTIAQGKIYRISPKNKKLNLPNIDLTDTEGQIKALLNPAIHVRALAAQALLDQGEGIIPSLANLLENPNPFYRARAIWLLAQLGETGLNEIQPLLEGDDPEIALASLRAMDAYGPDKLTHLAPQLGKNAHPAVKRELAILLGKEDWEQSKGIYLDLIKAYDGHDPWYLNALGIGLKEHRDEVFPLIQEAFNDPSALEWPDEMARLIWEIHPHSAVEALQTRLEAPDMGFIQKKLAMETLAFIPENQAATALMALSESGEGELSESALWWLQFRKHNTWQSFLEDWESPVDLLPAAHPELMVLREKLTDSLSTVEDVADARQKMAMDPVGRLHLVLLASTNKMPESSLTAHHPGFEEEARPAVKKLLDRYFSENKPEPDSQAEDRIAALDADHSAGKIKAIQNCMSCHKIGASGNEIGPDLSQIHLKMDKKTLINAIIEPDAAVGFGSEAFLLSLKNGSVLYGLLQSSGPVVTLLDSQGKKYIIPSADIAGRKQLPFSLMPFPSHMGLDEQDVADITAYLMQL